MNFLRKVLSINMGILTVFLVITVLVAMFGEDADGVVAAVIALITYGCYRLTCWLWPSTASASSEEPKQTSLAFDDKARTIIFNVTLAWIGFCILFTLYTVFSSGYSWGEVFMWLGITIVSMILPVMVAPVPAGSSESDQEAVDKLMPKPQQVLINETADLEQEEVTAEPSPVIPTMPEVSAFKGVAKPRKITTDGLQYTLKKKTVQALVKLSSDILEDDKVTPDEVEQLKHWLQQQEGIESDYRTALIAQLVLVESEVVDAEELKLVLSEFCDQQQVEWKQQQEKVLAAEQKKQREAELAKQPKPAKKPKAKRYEPKSEPEPHISLGRGDEVLITYEDAYGYITEREITVRTISRKGRIIYINALCHNVGEHRTFRADRIQDMMILDTGEYIFDVRAALS